MEHNIGRRIRCDDIFKVNNFEGDFSSLISIDLNDVEVTFNSIFIETMNSIKNSQLRYGKDIMLSQSSETKIDKFIMKILPI